MNSSYIRKEVEYALKQIICEELTNVDRIVENLNILADCLVEIREKCLFMDIYNTLCIQLVEFIERCNETVEEIEYSEYIKRYEDIKKLSFELFDGIFANGMIDNKEYLEMYLRDYDYFYLKNSVKRAIDIKAENIILGNSHALFAIDAENIEKTVNVSLQSQDIYYCSRIIEDILDKNKNIKKIVFDINHWILNFELSMCENGEQHRITNVYDHLYGEKSKETENKYNDVEELCAAYIYNQNINYFNKFRTRKSLSMVQDKEFFELTSDEKIARGRERAESHNRLKKYTDSFRKNIKILEDFIYKASKRGIEIYFVVFPTTSYYREYIDEGIESVLYEFLKKRNDVYLLDLQCVVDENSFVDFDHVNDDAADRLSECVKKKIID